VPGCPGYLRRGSPPEFFASTSPLFSPWHLSLDFAIVHPEKDVAIPSGECGWVMPKTTPMMTLEDITTRVIVKGACHETNHHFLFNNMANGCSIRSPRQWAGPGGAACTEAVGRRADGAGRSRAMDERQAAPRSTEGSRPRAGGCARGPGPSRRGKGARHVPGTTYNDFIGMPDQCTRGEVPARRLQSPLTSEPPRDSPWGRRRPAGPPAAKSRQNPGAPSAPDAGETPAPPGPVCHRHRISTLQPPCGLVLCPLHLRPPLC